MNKILLIFLAIFLFRGGVFALTEDEAIARIDRVVFFALYQLYSMENKIYNGSCCGTISRDKTCAPCKMRLVILRKDENPNLGEFTVMTANMASSSFVGSLTKSMNVDTKIYTDFKLICRVDTSTKFYDTWKGVDPKVVGVYPMNGVYGDYFKNLLFGAWSISAPLPNIPYYGMVFTIRNVERIYDPPKSGSMCPLATPFIIKANVESVNVWTSQIHAYNGANCSYPVKYTGGTDNPIILKENVALTLNFNDITTEETLIDSISIKNINTDDSRRSLEFLGMVGTGKKLKIDLDVYFNCKGYVGINCVFPCQPIDDLTDCKGTDGARYCKNGADDLKLCSVFTNTCHAKPCANGAKCNAFKTGYFCNCTEGWAGRDCRDSICRQRCFKGVCQPDTSCSCIPGYEGRWCDKSSCLDTDELKCTNGGNCMRIRDVATCVCPSFASGKNCSTLNCNPLCKMGKCEIKSNSKQASVHCTCVSGYTGSACEILISAPSIFNPSSYIYAVSGVSIAFALLVKIMIVFFLIPNLFKTEKTESTQSIS